MLIFLHKGSISFQQITKRTGKGGQMRTELVQVGHHTQQAHMILRTKWISHGKNCVNRKNTACRDAEQLIVSWQIVLIQILPFF